MRKMLPWVLSGLSGHARGAAGACVRWHGGGRSSRRGGDGMTRLLLVAASLAAGVGAGAEWDV